MMKTDVAILGGGLAGLTLALSVRRANPDSSVSVITGPDKKVSSYKLGESLVELSSHYLHAELELEDHLDSAHVPKLGLRFFNRGPKPVPLQERLEYGVFDPPGVAEDGTFLRTPVPAWQIDREIIEPEVRRRAEAAGVEIIEASATEADLSRKGHTVKLEDGRAISSRWVVDASGGRRFLPRQLDTMTTLDHRTDAMYFHVDRALDVEEFCDDPEFIGRMCRPGLRRNSTTHLTGPGYWVWMILLPSGETSVGIVVDPSREPLPVPAREDTTLAWLAEREPELTAALREAKLGPVRYRKGQSYGTKEVFSKKRWAVTGEAALQLDPLYSSGIDFIAITNTMIERLITMDLKGGSIASAAPLSEIYYQRLVDGYLQQYQSAYGMLGDTDRMTEKAIWDSALYFGVHSLLFVNGALGDPGLLPTIEGDLEEVFLLHHRAQPVLRDAQFQGPTPSYIGHAQVGILRDTYMKLQQRYEGDALVAALRDNIRRLTSHLQGLKRGERAQDKMM